MCPDGDITFEFPPGCGVQWLDVEHFDATSISGWLSQVHAHARV